jgi:putative acetyltransferase
MDRATVGRSHTRTRRSKKLSYSTIRAELPADEQAIHVLTVKAFAPMSFSDGSEAPILRALRRSGELSLSLVALAEEGEIVGHVAFSPVTINDLHNGWFGLGPISVDPAVQRAGIGRALVQSGLTILREREASGCALIGNPAIYSGYGFESDGLLTHGDLPVRIVQRVVFSGPAPKGELRFASSFEVGNH